MSVKKGKISILNDKGNVADSVNFTFNPSSYSISTEPHYKGVRHLTRDTEKNEFLGGVTRTLHVTLIFDSFSDEDLFPESVRHCI